MTGAKTSLFRDILQVSRERIATLDDTDLNSLMADLLRAHAYKCGVASSDVRINTEIKAPDDGCDGWSPKPHTDDAWFGSCPTCWQWKAGIAGQPRRLVGEALKPLPKETLAAGGRFVVVASGSTSGIAGERDRIEVLKRDAIAAGLPTSEIDVIGSDRLANWCNQHPSVAGAWAGRPAGLWRFDKWAKSEVHDAPWQATPDVQQTLQKLRRDLDLASGSLNHLHIHGPPGVGKTRFALELCRGAEWKSEVIYFGNASDFRLTEIIDSAVSEADVQLMVIADEVQVNQLLRLRDSIEGGDGRVRLVTIGHSDSPDPQRIPALPVTALDHQQMANVISAWHPSMPPENVEFVAEFADGYIKLAKLAADAVAQNPSINVRRLLDLQQIRGFLDQMLGTGSRRALHVVAVLTSVGWTEDVQIEAETIARHFSLDWNAVRAEVDYFHRAYGIAPRGGRYRYISPKPLAIYLAVEAWTIYPDLLKSLPNVLPSETSTDAYYDRLKSIASNPQAKAYAREQLQLFFCFDDFIDDRSMRRWAALSAADPTLAANRFLKAIAAVDPDMRRRIIDHGRRTAVWTLVSLAWRSSVFHDATMALALLAEAETETWTNNATGEFIARFQIYLGGTSMPYPERLTVIDELIATNRHALIRLVIKALGRVGSQHAHRTNSALLGDEPREREWQPANAVEHVSCIEQSVRRLTTIAERGIPDLQTDFVATADHLSMLLRGPATSRRVVEFYLALRNAYPELREPLRRLIDSILDREKRYWKEMSADDISALESVHHEFEDPSLAARLRQYVGHSTLIPEEQPDLTELAKELFANREALIAEWAWLTSGEANDGWRLGQAIAVVDVEGQLEHVLGRLPRRGVDLRILCGYITKRRESNGETWFKEWMASEIDRNPSDVQLLFEVVWRCGPTEDAARYVAATLKREKINPRIVGQLGFGRWGQDLSRDALSNILTAMLESGHEETAISILASLLADRPDEAHEWDSMALNLVTRPQLIRGRHMTGFYWAAVARRIVLQHAKAIATAIFRQQATREPESWMAAFTDAEKILEQCVEVDPEGVWDALKVHLSSPADALLFSIGFPRNLIDKVPPGDVRGWIAEWPDERAPIVAHMANKDLSSDNTLTASVLGEFGDRDRVAAAFLSNFTSGSWSGPISTHWEELASELRQVSKRTRLPKLRRWAQDAANSLQEMAERERQSEEEWNLRNK